MDLVVLGQGDASKDREGEGRAVGSTASSPPALAFFSGGCISVWGISHSAVCIYMEVDFIFRKCSC